MLFLDGWEGPEHTLGSEFASVLNISGLFIYLVLKIAGFWICTIYLEFWVSLNNFWTCLNMPEYVKIHVNVPKSAWIAFVLIANCNFLPIWTCGYLF